MSTTTLKKSKVLDPSRKLEEGRWSKEEHQRFMEGIQLYNKNWKKVEEHVQTRSGAQIRSHAQKFFNRLEKEMKKKQVQENQGKINNLPKNSTDETILEPKSVDQTSETTKNDSQLPEFLKQSSSTLILEKNNQEEKQVLSEISNNIPKQKQSQDKKQKQSNYKRNQIDYEELQNKMNQFQQFKLDFSQQQQQQQQQQQFMPMGIQPFFQGLQMKSGFPGLESINSLMMNCYQNWMNKCRIQNHPSLLSSPDKFRGIESQLFSPVITSQKLDEQEQESLSNLSPLIKESDDISSSSSSSDQNQKKIGSFRLFQSSDQKKQQQKLQNFKRKIDQVSDLDVCMKKQKISSV